MDELCLKSHLTHYLRKGIITMNTTTTATTSTTMNDDFMSALFADALNASSNQQEVYEYLAKNAFEAGLKAQVKKTKPKTERMMTEYASASLDMTSRINFAGEVVLNTLRKMTHGTPEDFSWAYGRGPVSVTGIYRNFAKPFVTKDNREISKQLSNGSMTVEDTDFVAFHIGGSMGYLPVAMLKNDPIAIAQMVRSKCRKYAEKRNAEQLRSLQRERDDLVETQASELRKLEKKLEAVENTSKLKPAGRQPKKKHPADVPVYLSRKPAAK